MNRDSSLVSKVIPVSTYTNMVGKKNRYIVIHHMAGVLNAEQVANAFRSRESSANYAICSDGSVVQYVPESDRAWTTSSWNIDSQAVTIEVSNDGGADSGWHVSDKNIEVLINLCADICRRNSIKRVSYVANDPVKSSTDGGHSTLQMHCWYASTNCPGQYLGGKFPYIAQQVNAKLGASNVAAKPSTGGNKSVDQLAQEVMAGKWGNDPQRTIALTNAGYNASAVQARVNELCGVKVAAKPASASSKKSNEEIANEVWAGKWGNGDDRKNRLTAAGYNYDAVMAIVNRGATSSAPAKKSNTAIAKEVIAGNWGNGEDRKNRLTAAGYNYNTIQALVNKMLG